MNYYWTPRCPWPKGVVTKEEWDKDPNSGIDKLLKRYYDEGGPFTEVRVGGTPYNVKLVRAKKKRGKGTAKLKDQKTKEG